MSRGLASRGRMYEHVTNVFNMCLSVSTDTKLYTCVICAYDIYIYFFPAQAFLRAPGVHWWFVNHFPPKTPLENYVSLTHYVGANLFHDHISSRSTTGILHLVNKTPVGWYSKKHSAVETITHSYEFISAFTCVVHIIDARNTLR